MVDEQHLRQLLHLLHPGDESPHPVLVGVSESTVVALLPTKLPRADSIAVPLPQSPGDLAQPLLPARQPHPELSGGLGPDDGAVVELLGSQLCRLHGCDQLSARQRLTAVSAVSYRQLTCSLSQWKIA